MIKPGFTISGCSAVVLAGGATGSEKPPMTSLKASTILVMMSGISMLLTWRLRLLLVSRSSDKMEPWEKGEEMNS